MAGTPKTPPPEGIGEQVLWGMLGGREHLHDIEAYEAAGGYEQLRRALGTDRDELVAQIKASNIRGRGGAGFPTGMKMGFIPKNTGKPIYLVCNADESEPCTFKDREIIERLPHLLIEGCLIAAHAIGSEAAFIYIRGEYLEPFEVLRDAAEQARAKGYLGADVLGSGWSPTLVIHRGAGAYICGEETALLSSLNGWRGQPTVKPPFPAVSGLYAAPTLVNNVETLATLPRIMAMGADSYAALGIERTGAGTRMFSLSGHVSRPRNYEAVIGTPLRELIELAGGVANNGTLKAVIPGGSSTPILTAQQAMEINLDYDSMTAAGTMFGSGSIVLVDSRTCMAQLALRVAEFYKHESCGKCTPCREGTKWTVDLLARLVAGGGSPGDVDLIYDVAGRILGRCLCPLGDAMAMPVRSYIEQFRSDFDRYLEPGFTPPDDSPLATIARHAVEHHEHAKPGVTWAGTLSRGAVATAATTRAGGAA